MRVPAPVVGHVLFATRGRDGVVGLDWLREENGSSVGLPAHCTWALPRDTGLSAWQLSLVESWLGEGKPVSVAFKTTPIGSKARFMCDEATVLVDTPGLVGAA